MKKAIILISTVVLMCTAGMKEGNAQQRVVEKTLQADSNEKLRLDLKFGDTIVVRGWDKNEVSFRAEVEINSGKLNDAFVANFVDDKQGIRIKTDFDQDKLKDGNACDCPDSKYSSYSWNSDGNHRVVCSNINFVLYVPKNSNLNLETIAADIELYDLNGPVNAKSISGYVDLSWPERNGADVSMQTVSGEAYSDLNTLTFRNRKDEIPMVGYELRGSIGNGDGPMLRLESVSGDVYLRKRKG